jgi:hypothetical protein
MRLDPIFLTTWGLPACLAQIPMLSYAGFGLAAVFLAMSYAQDAKDLRFFSLSALAYGLVPFWPMISG